MSWRFQHQSSSASSIKFARPQSHPSPASASTSRSSRYTRPCSTQQQPLSTPGTGTSRFRDRPSLKDEIETSFEEPAQSSPRLPSRLRFSSSVSRYRDVDDLDDENEEDDLNTNNLPPRSLPDQSGEIQDDELADLEFLERLRGTRGSQYPRQLEIDSPSEDETFATPIAARKRRRLENRTDRAFNSIDDVEHQLDLFRKQPTSNKENHNKEPAAIPPESESESESDSHLSSSPLATPSNPQPSTTSARFRLKPAHPRISASTSTSLAQTTPTANTPGHRPLFRPNPKQQPPSSPSLNAHLPPAFSPSRHRGGGGRARDYLPGGAADTVRNLILGLGVTEPQGQGQGQGQGGSRGIERVRVACVLRGSLGGRCVMFRDEAGRGWVLIGLGASDGLGVQAGRKRMAIANGCVVGVRMGWDVNLNMKCVDTQRDAEEDGCEDGRDALWKVAVLWDVLDA
ncbi:hypothetical protein GJ744_012269 [Endocarpon pusillum]|uniref:Uncharacterized protein n=1 Tax=Endocarpon pusillum TaxID=364733 RepID=A0A8H7ABJ6_9EURO|nr:hypothetical protein GJ744_012269 [Endocarpon pusillum]